MNVKLTNDDIIEACQEWMKKHYGIDAPSVPEMRATIAGNQQVYVLDKLALDFGNVPKPSDGPYR